MQAHGRLRPTVCFLTAHAQNMKTTRQTVTFPGANGTLASGFFCVPAGGARAPAILVVQEWWGLDEGIRFWTQRLADAGFLALAPDLYHGELAQHTEMDKAASLMKALPIEQATTDMNGALEFLRNHPQRSGRVGVMGFCMGGALCLRMAASRPDIVSACVPFYGFPKSLDDATWKAIGCAVSMRPPALTGPV